METLSTLLTSAMANWKYIAAVLIVAIVGVLVYRRFWVSGGVQGFANLGAECNPQIENSCGKGAICQSDETGMKGVCFPLPEEEAESAKEEVAAIASQAEEASADEGEAQAEEETSS